VFRAPVRVSAPERPVRVATSDRQRARSGYLALRANRAEPTRVCAGHQRHDILGVEIGGGGSAPVRVATSTMADHGPTISPDGSRIAFSSGRTGIEQIWVAGADGSNPRQLTFF